MARVVTEIILGVVVVPWPVPDLWSLEPGPAPLITNGTNINLVTIHLPGQPESGPFTEAKKCSYTGHRSQLRPPGAGRLCHKMSTFSTRLVRGGYTQTRKIKHDWGFLLRKKQILNLKELLVLYFA